MIRATPILVLIPVILIFCSDSNVYGESQQKSEKYLLRYIFKPGQTLKWDVVQRSRVRTSVSGTTQIAETVSRSVKVWTVKEITADGSVVFEHSVENVDMRQKLSGREEVRYNSRKDKKVPLGFENVAKAVGVPLTIVTMDDRGKILDRIQTAANMGTNEEGTMTIPLPEELIAVGQTWSFPHEISVPLESGGVKVVKTLQKFTLKGVSTGVATIDVETQILTPIHDPAIEAKMIQRAASGVVRFDVDAGCVLSQRVDLDKRVVGFRGGASSIHYLTRFTENLIDENTTRTACRESSDN